MVLRKRSLRSVVASYLFAAAMTSRCSLAWTTSHRRWWSSSVPRASGHGRRSPPLHHPRHLWTSTSPASQSRTSGAKSCRGGGGEGYPRCLSRWSDLSATTTTEPTVSTADAGDDAAPSPSSSPSSSLTEPLPVRSFGGLQYVDYGSRYRVAFVLGGPGAGKGTQSALLEGHYPVCHLSVGELLRNVDINSPHRESIESSLKQGKIVPVEISLSLLREAMADKVSDVGKEALFLVDGFPRNFDNLDGWSRLMPSSAVLCAVLVYQCPLTVLEARILERAKESGRSDDNLETVQRRFRTFERETIPVIERLRELSSSVPPTHWAVAELSGDQPLEQVWLDTQQVVNRLVLNDVLRANAALLQAVRDGDAEAYTQVCDPQWFAEEDADPFEVMRQQEGGGVDSNAVGDVANAQVDVLSGTHIAVSYDRVLQGQPMREKRFWSHQGPRGWRNVHFARIPTRDHQP